ncbi:hypothetical protein Tsubulata_041317, partial [Turnera subulata]
VYLCDLRNCSALGVALVNLIVLRLFTVSLIFLVGVSCVNTDGGGLGLLRVETHKFESHYIDNLVGNMFLAQMNPQFRAPEYVTRPVVMPCGTRPLEQQQWTNLPFGHLSFTGQQQMMPTVGASSSQPWQQAVSSSMPTFPSVSTAAPPIDQPTY